MKAIRLGVLIAFLVCWAPKAPAESELPPAAKEVLKQFEDETAEIEKKVEPEVKKRLEKTAAELKKVQDALCKEAKLDEALAVRELIRSLQGAANPVLSADLPPAAREVWKQHEDEVAEIGKKAEADIKKSQDKVAAELKKLQDLLCKDAKLDEAVAVRDAIRFVKAGVTNALPDPGYVNNLQTDIGKVMYYQVTGVKDGNSIYGTDVYTTGSHLGMAAVHCGLLKVGQVGVVKVTILPGQNNYPSSTRNGVTSSGWRSYNVSFKVEKVFGFVPKAQANAQPDPGTLTGLRGETGKSFLFEVTGSDAGSVWGTDIYTDDSTLATAAVHAGALTVGQKGIVKVTILPGQESYTSTARNGVTSSSYGAWSGSYRVEPVK